MAPRATIRTAWPGSALTEGTLIASMISQRRRLERTLMFDDERAGTFVNSPPGYKTLRVEGDAGLPRRAQSGCRSRVGARPGWSLPSASLGFDAVVEGTAWRACSCFRGSGRSGTNDAFTFPLLWKGAWALHFAWGCGGIHGVVSSRTAGRSERAR